MRRSRPVGWSRSHDHRIRPSWRTAVRELIPEVYDRLRAGGSALAGRAARLADGWPPRLLGLGALLIGAGGITAWMFARLPETLTEANRSEHAHDARFVRPNLPGSSSSSRMSPTTSSTSWRPLIRLVAESPQHDVDSAVAHKGAPPPKRLRLGCDHLNRRAGGVRRASVDGAGGPRDLRGSHCATNPPYVE